MNENLNKSQLVALVKLILAADGTEEELNHLVRVFQRNVPHPAASDLIFYPPKNQPDRTAEEIVELALSYRPLQLP